MATADPLTAEEIARLRALVYPEPERAPCWCCGHEVVVGNLRPDPTMPPGSHLCGQCWDAQPLSRTVEERGGSALVLALNLPRGLRDTRRRAYVAQRIGPEVGARAWIDSGAPPCSEPFGYLDTPLLDRARELLARYDHPPPPEEGATRWVGGVRYGRHQRWDGERWHDVEDTDDD